MDLSNNKNFLISIKDGNWYLCDLNKRTSLKKLGNIIVTDSQTLVENLKGNFYIILILNNGCSLNCKPNDIVFSKSEVDIQQAVNKANFIIESKNTKDRLTNKINNMLAAV